MRTDIVGTNRLFEVLKAQGYDLPQECVDVELQFPVDGPLRLKFLCNVTAEDARKIGLALAHMGDLTSAKERERERRRQAMAAPAEGS